jgi:hypothetical protein
MMTKKFKGVILSIAILVIALFLLPIAVEAAFDVQTDGITDSFPGCVVGGGSTDVVLTEDLYGGNVVYVSAITATGAGAVPVADSYVAGTNTLTVTGLGVDTPQDLTVTYSYEVNTEFNGVNTFTGIVPLLLVVGLIIVAIINGLWSLKRDD